MSSIRTTCPTRPLAFGSGLGPGRASSTTGLMPASASSQASISPLGPAPEMTMSAGWSAMVGLLAFGGLGQARADGGEAVADQVGDGHRRIRPHVGLCRRVADGAHDGHHQPRIHVAVWVGAGALGDHLEPLVK